jgi:predicted CopG family antitoxin
MTDQRKTLKLKSHVYARLEALKRESETWDGFITRLLNETEGAEDTIQKAVSLLEDAVKCERCKAYLASAVEIAGDQYCRDCALEVDASNPTNPVEESQDERISHDAKTSYDNYGGLREDTVWMVNDNTPVTRWPLSLEKKWWNLVNDLGKKGWFGEATNRHNVGNDLLERERYFRQTPDQQHKWDGRTPYEFMAYTIRASNSDRPPYWTFSIESYRRDGWPEEVLAEVESLLEEPEGQYANLNLPTWLLKKDN